MPDAYDPNYPPPVAQTIDIDVPPGYSEGERLDRFLTEKIAGASRSKVQAAIKEGRVSVNGEVADKTSIRVAPRDRIRCVVLRPPPVEAVAEDIPLDIVHEDEHLILVDKPAGMVVHPAHGNRTGTLVNALLHHVGAGSLAFDEDEEDDDGPRVEGLSLVNAAPQRPGEPTVRPGIVHRIDKDTSGLLVVAKDDVTHAHLARQFAAHTASRLYLAVAWGVPDPAEGTISAHVGRDPRDRKRMSVVREDQGKHAVSHYHTVETFAAGLALLQFRLETGRTHQIRVHAAHIGHPLLADATYGGDAPRAYLRTRGRQQQARNLVALAGRQMLHAATLGFVHPATGARVHFASDLPADMAAVLDKLRQSTHAPA
jgi:23S rRNA pseudouridine1911/1915/1917 synthase